MRRLAFSFSLLAFGVLTACGGSIQVSKEMKGFMEKLEETGSLSKAAKAYGFVGEKIPFAFYDFQRTAVQEADKKGGVTCYLLKLEKDELRRRVIVCWKEGSIFRIRKKA